MTITPEILTELKKFNRNVEYLKKRDKEESPGTWVKSTHITKITGLNGEGMRKLRNQGLVKVKKDETGIWYLLESVPKHLIK